MYSGFLFILAQPTTIDPLPRLIVAEQASARAVILEATRIDFSRIAAPRRPRTDGMRVLNFE